MNVVNKSMNIVKKMNNEIYSYAGGMILCINMIPQIKKTWEQQSAKELSYMFMGMNVTGLTLMSVYGILQEDKSLYIPMFVSLTNTIILIMLKLKLDNTKKSMSLPTDAIH